MFTEKVFVEDKKHGVENTFAYSDKIEKELKTMMDATKRFYEQYNDPEQKLEHDCYLAMFIILGSEEKGNRLLPEKFVEKINDAIQSLERAVIRDMKEYSDGGGTKHLYEAMWNRKINKVMYSFLDDVCIGL